MFNEILNKFELFFEDEADSEKDKYHDSISNGVKQYPDDDKYPHVAGLEGPYKFKNGAVFYYDPKVGMYYDSDNDKHISYSELLGTTDQDLSLQERLNNFVKEAEMEDDDKEECSEDVLDKINGGKRRIRRKVNVTQRQTDKKRVRKDTKMPNFDK